MTDSKDAAAVLPKVELTKKQELNNHIVLMRKHVRQARIHIIGKLNREVKLLQKRKGPEKVQNKAKRKAERLIQEILVLKKLKKDVVSVFALQNKKSLLDILRNEKSTIEKRSIARLAHHSAVQSQVNSYRESNPHWELQIPILLEKTKEKLKKIKKKEEDRTGGKEDPESVKNKSLVKTPAASETEDIIDQKRVTKAPIKKSGKEKKRVVEATKQPIKLEKSEGTLRVQILKDLKELENDDLVEQGQSAESTEVAPMKRPKSAFFVGGEERKELTPEKDSRKTLQFKDPKRKFESSSQPIFKRGKLQANNQERFAPKNQESKNHRFSRYYEDNSYLNVKSTTNSNFVKTGEFRNQATFKGRTEDSKSASTASGHLHPSWEAKKRQAAAITSFQGKKITFEDD